MRGWSIEPEGTLGAYVALVGALIQIPHLHRELFGRDGEMPSRIEQIFFNIPRQGFIGSFIAILADGADELFARLRLPALPSALQTVRRRRADHCGGFQSDQHDIKGLFEPTELGVEAGDATERFARGQVLARDFLMVVAVAGVERGVESLGTGVGQFPVMVVVAVTVAVSDQLAHSRE